MEIHQLIFQSGQKTFQTVQKFLRLLFFVIVCHFRIVQHAFNLVVTILAVRNRILQLTIGKQIKTHFPDVFLSKLRKDVRNVVRKNTVWRQDQNVGRFQIFPVMVEQIRNAVQSDGCFTAACRTLNHHDPVLCIADNGILLLLYGADDIFQCYRPIASEFSHEDFVINLHIALKLIDHLAAADFVLPLGSDFSCHFSQGSLIGSRSFIKVIKKSAHRCTPVVNQRHFSRLFCKISDSDIENLRFFLPFIKEVYSAKKRRIQHLFESSL